MAKILVIDDSRITLRYLCSLLEEAGHDVVSAKNGKEGLDVLEEAKPNCVLCDLLMPELDGFGFLEEVQTRQIEVPVIISTADLQDATRNRCLELGALTLVNKPTSKENLYEAVELALSGVSK